MKLYNCGTNFFPKNLDNISSTPHYNNVIYYIIINTSIWYIVLRFSTVTLYSKETCKRVTDYLSSFDMYLFYAQINRSSIH